MCYAGTNFSKKIYSICQQSPQCCYYTFLLCQTEQLYVFCCIELLCYAEVTLFALHSMCDVPLPYANVHLSLLTFEISHTLLSRRCYKMVNLNFKPKKNTNFYHLTQMHCIRTYHSGSYFLLQEITGGIYSNKYISHPTNYRFYIHTNTVVVSVKIVPAMKRHIKNKKNERKAFSHFSTMYECITRSPSWI